MATPKQLVQKVAELTGVPVNTVVQHDRNLADAGLRTVAGRGRAAARVTSLDAANLLIAVAASRNVKDSALIVQTYGTLEARGAFTFDEVSRGETLVDALVFFLELLPKDRDAFADPDKGRMEVRFYGLNPRAEISFLARDVSLDLEFHPGKTHPSAKWKGMDLEFISRFTQITVGHVGELISA